VAIAYAILERNTIAAQQYVDRSDKVLATSQSAFISLLNAETGLRGYFISKRKIFLEPYQRALLNLEPSLNNLEYLVQDKPIQLQRAILMSQIAHAKMSQLQTTVKQIEANDVPTPELASARILKGKESMDRFRQVLEEFEIEERRLRVLRSQSLAAQQDFNSAAMLYGVLLAMLGTALAIRLLRQLAVELRNRELRLRESRNLIETIVANVVDGVMVINPHGKIETFNHAAVKMFGYTATEVIGWEWQKLLNRSSTEAVPNGRLTSKPTAEFAQKLSFHTPDLVEIAVPNGKIWQAMGQHKNGSLFPIEVSMNSIVLDDDRIAIVRDISERQQTAARLQAKAIQMAELNHSLNTTNQSLLQSNRELDQFAYITAHDLKAPLRAIASLSEWIEEDIHDSIPTETQAQMQLLRSRVCRMQALLDSLLEYARSGRRQAPIVSVDVKLLLSEIIQLLAPPATFAIEITSAMPTFDTRRQSLKQVFTHLIDNAIRHHPTEMGTVKISAIDLWDRYEFTIADNGEGIEPEFQEKIYTIFQTLKARDIKENIGAGLAIVKKIITAEGGEIQLESSAGSGAIFRFTWLKQPIVKLDSPLAVASSVANRSGSVD
jgi:signal transduction histidine kinase/CHASE3 domain sensor protein